MRTGLAVGVDAAALVGDEGVDRSWFVVDKFADEDGGTGVVGDDYEGAGIVKSDLTRIVPHGLDSG